MAKILMAWEVGGGLGHVGTLLTLARRFRDRGHTPIFALKNITDTAPMFRDDDFPVLQAPVWPEGQYRGKVPPTRGFADILAFHGLSDPERTLAMFRAWSGLVDEVRPDLIIADYAPALCMVMRGRIPVMAVGAGFYLPPADRDSFPALQPGVNPQIDRGEFLDRLNGVLKTVKAQPLSRLPAIFDVQAHFVACLPLFDPYAKYRTEPADGSLGLMIDVVPLPRKRRVFVYLSLESRNLKAVFEGLKMTGLPVTAFVRGANRQLREQLGGPGIEMLDAPVPYRDILPRCSLVVHQGGLGTASSCLAAGRPQVVVPLRLERQFNGQVVADKKAGLVLKNRFSAPYFAAAIRKVFDTRDITANAVALGQSIDRDAYADLPARITDRALALLGK